MNAATAAGFLGGEVSAKFVPNSKSNASGQCDFTRVSNSAGILRIEVAIMEPPKTQFADYAAKCRTNAKPLKAIGNEAVMCSSAEQARVIGRVRDQAFIITLSAAEKEQVIEKAAEIVAGNLF